MKHAQCAAISALSKDAMKLPREIFTGNISNKDILMELTDTDNQRDLLKKLVSLCEKHGVEKGVKNLLNILKGSFSFILPFRRGTLFYCDFYRKNKIFKESIICSEKCRGRLVYVEDGKCRNLNIFHPLKDGSQPEYLSGGFMEIILNGEKTTISPQENLMTYIEELGVQWKIDLEGAVVLINNDIVKKNVWNETPIKEGDSLEVLSFVSGG